MRLSCSALDVPLDERERLGEPAATPLEEVRALTHHGAASSSVEIDLERTYSLGPLQELPKAPLGLLLGLDGSDTRLLELVIWAPGYDWACRVLGRPQEPEGSEITGAAAIEVAADAIRIRSEDLATLERVARQLASVDGDLGAPAASEAVDDLQRLAEGTRVVPSELLGPDGQLVMAFESDDLVALAAVELMYRSEHLHALLRPCGHCGRLFSPRERADEEYCRRAAPGEAVGSSRTCHNVGPQRRYAATVDALTARYRREYKRLDKQQRRGGFPRSELDAWRHAARDLLESAKHEGKSLKDFELDLHTLTARVFEEQLSTAIDAAEEKPE